MTYWKKITRSNFFIKLKSWEYWPFGIVQFPAIIYWLWLSVRARSLVFFSASNPGIEMGGMFGESKFEILKKIPCQYIPRTILIKVPSTVTKVMGHIENAGLQFPLIFKPDMGERGFMVRKISDQQEIQRYLNEIRMPFLIQEFVHLPLEFGVFFMKQPGENKGSVISVVAKEMLSVSGDGKSTLKELILRYDRAKLQWEKLKPVFHDQLNTVIPERERVELVSIGNHALGTRFINANHLIHEKLCQSFDKISSQIPGFHFGRFDLRCETLEDLYRGKVQILELNGCGAEPAHIYDIDCSLWEALGVLITHWQHIFTIATANKRRGVNFASHREAFSVYRKFKSVVK
jgi:hypothetical protein